jgi:tryptophan synthase alpha chain
MVKRVRATTDAPFGLLTYANIVYHLGFARFCGLAASSGIDSVLVADMPPEESGGLLAEMRKHGLRSVFIVSELTPPDRMRFICANTDAFVYVVSRLGTTGVQTDFSASVRGTVERLRAVTRVPLCVGFGISTPVHVTAVARAGADGAIVGSRLVSIIEKKLRSTSSMLRALDREARRLRGAALRAGRGRA